MDAGDADAAAGLQIRAFPPPFPSELLWQPAHLRRHVEIFPEGQFVAEVAGRIVGSCSNLKIDEANWNAHSPWDGTVGGPFLTAHVPTGSTLYGVDVTVDPEFRRRGIARAFYEARFRLVRSSDLKRYGTACRIPGFSSSGEADARIYAKSVVAGTRQDATLTPLLRIGMTFVDVIDGYMIDVESGNFAALLEWRP